MAMRKSTRRELRKLRELVHLLLAAKRCCFCRKPLVEVEDGWQGSGDGPQLAAKVTIHHKNGDHDDNRPSNHALCHQTCHKSHHMKITRRAVSTHRPTENRT